MNQLWYNKSAQQTENTLKTNAASGLTRKAARVRLRKNGTNRIYNIPQPDTLLYMGKHALDFTSILLFITAGIAFLFGQRENAAVLFGVWIINFLLAALTYVKSQQIFSAMYGYSIPQVCVLREGKLALADSRSLVCGDVILLREGDIVACDARVVSSDGLAVLQTDVTGEGAPVYKNIDVISGEGRSFAEQTNMVFASSTVVGGSGRAIVTVTGKDTNIVRMKGELPLDGHGELSVISQVKQYCRTQGLFVVGLVFVITVLDLILSLRGGGLFNVFTTSLCLAAASMSELVGALGYIIVARGVAGAALSPGGGHNRAIIKNISKIEQLRSLNCIVLDSGVLYDMDQPEAAAIYAGGVIYRQPDIADGIKSKAAADELIKYALIVSGSMYGRGAPGGKYVSSDGEALESLAESAGFDFNAAASEYLPFDKCVKGGASRFETMLTGHAGTFIAVMRGDVAEILNLCTKQIEDNGVLALDQSARSEILQAAGMLFDEGCRVYAVAYSVTEYNNLRRIGAIQSDMVFAGLIALRESLKEGTRNFIEECRKSDMRLIMLHNGTAADAKRLAAGCGMDSTDSYSPRHSGTHTDMMPDVYNIYAGLDSQVKSELLRELKRSGLRVGVISSMFSDIRLLHEADVSFTPNLSRYSTKKVRDVNLLRQGATGCQALKRKADVIIGDSAAACLEAVRYSKSIYDNFKSSASYLITIQLARMFLVICSVISGIDSLTAAGILVSGLIFDFGAVMVFAFEKPSRDILLKSQNTKTNHWKLSSVNIPLVLISLLWSLVVIAVPAFARTAGMMLDADVVRSYSFIALILSQLALLFVCKKGWRDGSGNVKLSPMLAAYTLIGLLFLVLCVSFPFIGGLFGVKTISAASNLFALIPPAVLIGSFVVYKMLFGNTDKK